MTFREDLQALRSSCAALRRELGPQRKELFQLRQEAQQLEALIAAGRRRAFRKQLLGWFLGLRPGPLPAANLWPEVTVSPLQDQDPEGELSIEEASEAELFVRATALRVELESLPGELAEERERVEMLRAQQEVVAGALGYLVGSPGRLTFYGVMFVLGLGLTLLLHYKLQHTTYFVSFASQPGDQPDQRAELGRAVRLLGLPTPTIAAQGETAVLAFPRSLDAPERRALQHLLARLKALHPAPASLGFTLQVSYTGHFVSMPEGRLSDQRVSLKLRLQEGDFQILSQQQGLMGSRHCVWVVPHKSKIPTRERPIVPEKLEAQRDAMSKMSPEEMHKKIKAMRTAFLTVYGWREKVLASDPAFSSVADLMEVSEHMAYFSFSERPDYSMEVERWLGLPEEEFRACANLIMQKADDAFLAAILLPHLAGKNRAPAGRGAGPLAKRADATLTPECKLQGGSSPSTCRQHLRKGGATSHS